MHFLRYFVTHFDILEGINVSGEIDILEKTMQDFIKEKFKNYGFNLTDKQANDFAVYYEFLVQENEKYNLTAITEKEDVTIKHFIDSVLPEKYISKNASVIDVGTGAGFPGVPLKILRPDIKLTLVDSLQKRINFLNMLIEKLQLKGVETFHARSEDFAQTHREKYDVALSRAVASLPTLSEYLLPLVKVGGKALMYKSERLNEELSLGQKAITVLGGKVGKTYDFTLEEFNNSKRFILEINKIKPTDKKYPRGKNLPKTKPIA